MHQYHLVQVFLQLRTWSTNPIFPASQPSPAVTAIQASFSSMETFQEDKTVAPAVLIESPSSRRCCLNCRYVTVAFVVFAHYLFLRSTIFLLDHLRCARKFLTRKQRCFNLLGFLSLEVIPCHAFDHSFFCFSAPPNKKLLHSSANPVFLNPPD